MADELLIRIYDVGLGDCIFCRIPDAIEINGSAADFHMLIDCGTWSESSRLSAALDNVATLLPDADGKKRLDLLVVTHEHKDHISGLDPALFERFKIGAIWMSAAMNPDHHQSTKTRGMASFASQAMRSIAAQGLALGPELSDLVNIFAINNSGAVNALRVGLPASNGIKPTYVHAGTTHGDHGLPLVGAAIRVLGPENDIDGFYLGSFGPTVQAFTALSADGAAVAGLPPMPVAPIRPPSNIGAAEFRNLRARMLSNALAFAALSSKATNNSSVVLLVEWKGKRLLFVGDAEWEGKFKLGKANGAWNVMWNQRRAELGKPVDFLKIGHHGSENATPWDQGTGVANEPAAILDAILPVPAGGQSPRARAVVSTERGKYKTIPRSQLLAEIGRRVANAQDYTARFAQAALDVGDLPRFSEFEQNWISQGQPERTDFERLLTRQGFIDVKM